MSPSQRLAAPRRLVSAAPGLDTPVRTIMRAGVISVPDDASVRDVQRALVAHRVHAVLVVDARTGEAVGWGTTLGVLEHLLGRGCSRLLIRRHEDAPPDGVVTEMDLVRLATPE